jgi:hypothetical protein
MTETFSHFFKPDVRAAGEDLLSTKAVYLKIGSDTLVEATVKASSPSQVSFRSDSIESAEFTVDCSCKASAKGQMCKHIWATLVLASEKQPDFFENKTTLEKSDSFQTKSEAAKKPATTESAKRQQEFEDRQAALKQRAADARKQQYQIQKARAKERSGAGTSGGSAGNAKSNLFLSDDVKQALKYFETNGFTLGLPINEEELGQAKRVLSRVFHPDKGGSTDEVLELNRNAEILLKHR